MEYFNELHQTKVFEMATDFECQAMMFCFKTRFKTFKKNEIIIKQGEPNEDMVLILKGSANVENFDDNGEVSILMELGKGEVYGIEQAYANEQTYKDSVVAKEKTFVMYMNKHRVITPCENHCKRHEIVVRALMRMVAERNVQLLEKIMFMSQKTIREKLLAYFENCAQKNNSPYFEIPFNKTELASYLSVDRSAMATELGKLRDEGLVDYDKKQYHLNVKRLK